MFLRNYICKEHTEKLNYLGKKIGRSKKYIEFLLLMRVLSPKSSLWSGNNITCLILFRNSVLLRCNWHHDIILVSGVQHSDSLHVYILFDHSFCLTKKHSILWMHHIFFIQFGDGYVSCFFLGTVVNNAAVSICVALMGEMFLFLESEWGGWVIWYLCVNLWGTVELFSKIATWWYFPTSDIQGRPFTWNIFLYIPPFVSRITTETEPKSQEWGEW